MDSPQDNHTYYLFNKRCTVQNIIEVQVPFHGKLHLFGSEDSWILADMRIGFLIAWFEYYGNKDDECQIEFSSWNLSPCATQ